MAQSYFVKIVGGVVIGAAAASVTALLLGINLTGDTETGVTLSPNDSAVCELSGKETEVRVRKNKKAIWKIRNYCTDSSTKTVSVGNFRKGSASSVKTCANATDGSITYPFTDDSLTARTKDVSPGHVKGDGSVDPGDAKLDKLKVKDTDAIYGTYYFDICLGGQTVEPRLIVER